VGSEGGGEWKRNEPEDEETDASGKSGGGKNRAGYRGY